MAVNRIPNEACRLHPWACVPSPPRVPLQASKGKKGGAPEVKALDRPAISSSLTKLAFVGDAGRVRELLDPAEGKASAEVTDKDG